MLPDKTPSEADLLDARHRIAPYVIRTPLFTCHTIDEMTGARLVFKAENLQKVGAFKFRGACNAVFSLSEAEAMRGVTTHSSGNHAQALSLAARIRGIAAHIVMPENAPAVKVAAVRGYGARITFCEPTLQARASTATQIVERTGARFIHPYDDQLIVAGQASAALEALETLATSEDEQTCDFLMTPVGGGGLLSGTALAARYTDPSIQVYGGEPAGADDAYRSFQSGTLIPQTGPKTIADGLLTGLGQLTWPIIREAVAGIFTCSEEAIIVAMRLIWERMKLVVEPSGAVPLACIMENKPEFKGKRGVVVLSGGNVDLDKVPWLQ